MLLGVHRTRLYAYGLPPSIIPQPDFICRNHIPTVPILRAEPKVIVWECIGEGTFSGIAMDWKTCRFNIWGI